MKSVQKLCETIIMSGETDSGPNYQGNTVHWLFMPSERYLVDFADDFTAEHWQQYDTDQDAAYFGVWVNPFALRTLTYAEGDWTLVSCLDNQRYNLEIESMNTFYGEGFIAKALDDNDVWTTYMQDREKFLIPTEN